MGNARIKLWWFKDISMKDACPYVDKLETIFYVMNPKDRDFY